MLLSHKLGITTPNYAAEPGLIVTPLKRMDKGDSCNTFSITLPNHLGTHIDAPNHFDEGGRPIASYSMEDLVFTSPLLLELPKEDGELVRREELEEWAERIERADLLLIKTGFQRYRHTDPLRYSTRNPGLSAPAAEYLASFHRLRALGIDSISISSVLHREEGRRAHRALLVGRDFFIIEDMDLASYPKGVKRIMVIPLFIEGIDSAPCTILAEV